MLEIAEKMVEASPEQQRILLQELKARHKEQVNLPIAEVKSLLFDIIDHDCQDAECIRIRESAFKLGSTIFKRNG